METPEIMSENARAMRSMAPKQKTQKFMADFLRETQESFIEVPFCPVDSLVLSSLVYLNLDEYRYGNVHGAECVPVIDILRFTPLRSMLSGGWLEDAEELPDFLRALACSRRYADLCVSLFANETAEIIEKQFCACTFTVGAKDGAPLAYLAFRGTDGTIAGWKEDFNMAFQYPVPAQVSAAEYLKKVASLWDGPILLTGHSKGGNLAVYAAMNAEDEIKDRVERIYSLDGPGFPEEVVKSFEYASVSDRIVKIVPDSSVVGMVFETPERCVVVKSDVDGIMQHFAFSWQMHGGEFAKAEDVADSSVVFNKSLNGWLAGLSKEQREHAVDALFSVLEASGAGSISAIVAAGPKVIPEMLGTYVGLSSADRRNINQALVILLQAALARNPKVQRK